MSMTFNKMCKIVLNEGTAKGTKFADLILGNASPVFTPDDVLRDPSDPSKGTKLYIAQKAEEKLGLSPGDPQSIRRQIRALNWIANQLIRRYKNKPVSLEKLTKDIQKMVEDYQTKVLDWGKPDKANTGYTVRVIGNLLLPPTGRTPNAKSVFVSPGMPANGTPANATKPIKPPRGVVNKMGTIPEPISANELQKRFEQMVQHLDAMLDEDLQHIIMKHADNGSTVRDILRDPAVKDSYDQNSVRELIKNKIKTGQIERDPETGALKTAPEYAEQRDSDAEQIYAARARKDALASAVESGEEIDPDIGDEGEIDLDEPIIPEPSSDMDDEEDDIIPDEEEGSINPTDIDAEDEEFDIPDRPLMEKPR